MKAFFEGIQWLFENIFFIPQNYLRELLLIAKFKILTIIVKKNNSIFNKLFETSLGVVIFLI
jgi:hypothetical protein